MARRSAGTDWSGLTRLIEHHLSGMPGCPARVRVESRLERHSPGLHHDNYFFAVGGRDLLLRMAKRYRPLRTARESGAALRAEAGTLQTVAGCRFSYPAPRLICEITDEAGKTSGLIETCLDGVPLSMSPSADGDFRLHTIAEVAAQVHQLPPTAFSLCRRVPTAGRTRARNWRRCRRTSSPNGRWPRWPATRSPRI